VSPTGLDLLYVTYWSLRDPLCQSQSLPVVKVAAARGWRTGLMTYEQPPWAMDAEERARALADLEGCGISWWPLRYHKRPAGISTAADVLAGAARAWWACRSGLRLAQGRGTVAAAVAWAAARLRSARFFNDADSPLSEEYVDAGVWRRGSLLHRLTGAVERRLLAASDAVAVLTESRRRQAAPQARVDPVVLPCGVDTGHFEPRPEVRASTRHELGLDGTVLVYAGKSGGWYLVDEMLDFVAAAAEVLGPLSLLVLTPEPPARFAGGAERRGIRCVVRFATRDEMPSYLSAADAGLSFILPAPSKKASSPVKNGEYLACGLPVVTTPRIGDYSELIARREVGVVVDELNPAGYARGAARLKDLLADPTLRPRCRQVARDEVGLHEVVIPRYVRIYQELLGAPREEP
jgi:glycosyltransferase involved in cell wall biosynthesis